MGAEEIDLAGKAYAAFNRGDVDGALQHLHPDVEWNMSDAFARAPRTYRGHDGVREVWALFDEALEDFTAQPVRMHDAGGAIVAEVRMSGRARGTREAVALDLVQVWTIRERQATRLDVYATLEEAWAAVGNATPPDSSDSISAAGTGREK